MVEFLLVGAMTSVLALGVLQVAFVLYVRNTVADAAAEGARFATLEGATASDAVERTTQLISLAVGPAYAADVRVESHVDHDALFVQVTVQCPLGLAGSLLPVTSVPVAGLAARPLTPQERGMDR